MCRLQFRFLLPQLRQRLSLRGQEAPVVDGHALCPYIKKVACARHTTMNTTEAERTSAPCETFVTEIEIEIETETMNAVHNLLGTRMTASHPVDSVSAPTFWALRQKLETAGAMRD
jgi:hypothetical protein